MRSLIPAYITCFFLLSIVAPAAVASDPNLATPNASPPGTKVPNLAAEEIAAIRNAILGQLNAFKHDNAEKAFSYASEKIQRIFRTPQIFLQMVRKSYQAVYNPRSFKFRKTRRIEGQVIQPLSVVGPSGVKETALYVMEKQADGIWKIGACIMANKPGKDT
jgi:hypothetical protein